MGWVLLVARWGPELFLCIQTGCCETKRLYVWITASLEKVKLQSPQPLTLETTGPAATGLHSQHMQLTLIHLSLRSSVVLT